MVRENGIRREDRHFIVQCLCSDQMIEEIFRQQRQFQQSRSVLEDDSKQVDCVFFQLFA